MKLKCSWQLEFYENQSNKKEAFYAVFLSDAIDWYY